MANDTKTKSKRKQYLVAKMFQVKYIGLILLLMFLTAALCSYVVYYTSMIIFGEKLANVYPQGRLIHIVRIVNIRILLSVLLVTPLVATLGLFLSHKIAGPIYRMERFLFNMSEGDMSSTIVLREGDELVTLANGINRLADSIKISITSQKSHLSQVSNELERLKALSSMKPLDLAAISISINKLDSEISAMSVEFEKYKV